jgi:GNAT superfamily N-acetyltransferase
MNTLEIRRFLHLPPNIAQLRDEATNEGFRFMEKLVNEWDSQVNRFDKPGELFVGAFQNNRLVAVGGLNIDPYLNDITVARVRHLYVLRSVRRMGVASGLVRSLIDKAQISFKAVRLFTDTKEAAEFYETLGFARSTALTAAHIMRLG